MPLTLLIESELDERSATAAANRAERVYADASRNIAKSMTSQIGEGARETGKAVEKMADSARASYQKVLKAQDELARSERQLKQMREDGTRGVEVQAERVRQARKREKDAVREAAAAMEEYDQSIQRTGESGVRAGAQLGQGLRQGVERGISDVTRQFGALGNVAENAFSGISRSGGIAALGVAGVGLAAVAVGQQLYQLGFQWDAISDKISMRTGASGNSLSGITDSVKRVASDTAAPLEAIGDISGQVVQSMKLTGPELDAMTQRLTILQEAGNPVGVRDLAKAYNVFGIEAKDQTETLDRLFNVSQQTGIPMQELVSTLTSAGRATKQFGLDAGQTAGLLATFERAGLSGDSTTKALTIALKNFSKEGKDAGPALSEAIQRIQDLSDAGRNSEAAMVAASTFGGKSYLDMLNAIKDHRLSPDELSAPFKAAGDSIPEAANRVEDFAEKWQKLKNTFASGELASAAGSFFNFINGQMQQSIDLAKNWNDAMANPSWKFGFLGGGMDQLPPSQAPTSILGANGPGFQHDRSTPLGPSFGSLGTHLGIGGSDLSKVAPGTPFWGYPDKDSKSGGSSSAQVPYGPGYGAPPRPGESSTMYDAEQNVLEAEHKRATAEAELKQVMSDSTHTTNDKIKAENDLTQARKGEIDAQMRLHDTTVKAAESLNKATNQLSEFGAGIDADFGISKGLSGIADNLVRFLGNLAMAGPMAQMNAISNANPNQGSGLMGFLGSTGAFGPQYTPQAIAAAGGGTGGGTGGSGTGGSSGYPTAGGYGNYSGDAALLSAFPKQGHYNPSGDLSKGLGDCSSAIEDLVNIMDGKPTAGRSMATGNEAQWLTERGFLPTNKPMPGTFQVGLNPEHTQATLPGGTNFNYGSEGAAQSGGVAPNSGAWDPAFNQHYYRPAGGGGGASTGPASTTSAPTTPTTPAPSTGASGGGWGLPSPVAAPVGGGQGYPLPMDSPFGNPTYPGPGGNPFGPDVSSTMPGQIGPFAVPGAVGAAGNAIGAGRSLVDAGRSAEQQPQQSDPYGVAPTTGPGAGGGGIGITPGGTIDTAIGMAAAAFPGVGAAAQTGMKLASRTIQYAGQVAGIGMDALAQTFLPAESQKAGSGWLQRGIGALASVKPALPNLAGGKGSPAAIGGAAQGQGQGQPPPAGNTFNTTVNSSASTITGAAKDAEFHQSAQNSGPGWR